MYLISKDQHSVLLIQDLAIIHMFVDEKLSNIIEKI